MSERRDLEAECAKFARYLSGAEPDRFVIDKYVAAHEAGAVELPGTSSYERAVVGIARNGPVRMLDAHSRVFANGNLLRRKLVLVLALLETRSPSAEKIDTAVPGSTVGLFLRIGVLGVLFAARVAVASVLLLPVRLACALGGGR
jgi:hypothetical protein